MRRIENKLIIPIRKLCSLDEDTREVILSLGEVERYYETPVGYPFVFQDIVDGVIKLLAVKTKEGDYDVDYDKVRETLRDCSEFDANRIGECLMDTLLEISDWMAILKQILNEMDKEDKKALVKCLSKCMKLDKDKLKTFLKENSK